MLRVAICSAVSLAASLLAADKPADKFDDLLTPFVENFKVHFLCFAFFDKAFFGSLRLVICCF